MPHTQNDHLTELTERQREAATTDGAVLVLAGAGTGKTKTLVSAVAHRLSVRNIPPERILVTTFTNKAASEIAGRIHDGFGADLEWVGTFHGLAAAQLRENPEIAELSDDFDIINEEDAERILRRLMKTIGLPTRDSVTRTDLVKPVMSAINWMKDNLIAADGIDGARSQNTNNICTAFNNSTLNATACLYPVYQHELRKINACDYGDLLLSTTLTMKTNDDYRKRWSGNFDQIMADEYQDVNYAQDQWLKLLAQDHGQLFVVGDDDQSIYGWRGSDIRYIQDFKHTFPGCKQIVLEQNFRSTGHILDDANAIIASVANRIGSRPESGKRLFTGKGEGDQIEILGFSSGINEAVQIATEIRRRHDNGEKWADQAVIYRYNHLAEEFKSVFASEGIPFQVTGANEFFKKPEIRDCLALAKLIAKHTSAQSNEAFRRVVNNPSRGIGDKAIEAIEAYADANAVSMFDALKNVKLSAKARIQADMFIGAIETADAIENTGAALTAALSQTGYLSAATEMDESDDRYRVGAIEKFVEIASDYDDIRTVADKIVLDSMFYENTIGDGSEQDRVVLTTIHGAKGLEFQNVFLPGWEQGLFPAPEGDTDEECRLAYVAITRAMKRCTISSTLFRQPPSADTIPTPTRPSHFISMIPKQDMHPGWLDDQTMDCVLEDDFIPF